MTITADSTAGSAWLRASSDTQLALTPPACRAAQGAGSRVWRSSACRGAGGRGGRAREERGCAEGRDARLMMLQRPLWSLLCDHYLRLEVFGWEGLPAETSLLVGVHSGGALTMDAWTLVAEWYRRFGDRRIFHATPVTC
jgi:hypothetical protein